jgi:hypothetical protein
MEKLSINNDLFFGEVVKDLEAGKTVVIPVKGYSMLPFIKGERDLVELEGVCSCTDDPLRKSVSAGDIVLFRYLGRYILHRVVSVGETSVVTAGDGVIGKGNVERPGKDDVLGRVTAVLKGGKRRTDPYSFAGRLEARVWRFLWPVRRWLLAAWKRLPWNRWILNEQRNNSKL